MNKRHIEYHGNKNTTREIYEEEEEVDDDNRHDDEERKRSNKRIRIPLHNEDIQQQEEQHEEQLEEQVEEQINEYDLTQNSNNNNKLNLNSIFYNIFNTKNRIEESSNHPLPLCGICESIINEEEAMMIIHCQFCSHIGCIYCTPQCFVCGERFCKNCSLQNYDTSYERTICIDCNCSLYSNLFP